MSQDITRILREWEYTGETQARIVVAEDGRRVLQSRLPMGIEQYELEGRPDGARPAGFESLLDMWEDRKRKAEQAASSALVFSIPREDVAQLQGEGLLYYYRYSLLLILGEHDRVIQDTAHNLRLCDFVEAWAEHSDDRVSLAQYRPHIIRIHTIALALSSFARGELESALLFIRDSIGRIESLSDIESPTFQFERARALNNLKDLFNDLSSRPVDEKAKLKARLQEALEAENYEAAAEIRDRLREFGES